MSRGLGDDSTIVVDEMIHKITSSRRTSCDICRERKIRCDKEHPACERCKRLKLKCTYTHQSEPLDVSRALMQLHERLQQAEAALAAARSQPPTDSSQDASVSASASASSSSSSSSSSGGTSSTSLGDWEMATDSSPEINNDPNLFMNFLTDASPRLGGLWPISTTTEGINPLAPPLAQISSHPSAENMNALRLPPRTTSVISSASTRAATRAGAGAGAGTGTAAPLTVTSSSQPILPVSRPSTALSYSAPSLQDAPLLSSEPGGIGQQILPILHQRYFDAIQSIPYVINCNRFYWIISQYPNKHQVRALSNAVAMAGAALSEDFPHLEAYFYHAARHHIEQAERQEDGSNFQNLEIVQALLLILRYEFTEIKSLARAWMTHGRAVRLLKLLSLDIMDNGDALLPSRTLRVPRASPMTSAEIDETRRTFWVSFNMDFFISALTQTAPMLQVNEIFTYPPSANPAVADLSAKLFLKDILNNLGDNTGYIFSPLIFATGIGNQVLQHLSMSAQPQYDFWKHHFDLDRTLSECIRLSPLCRSSNPMICDKIMVMTHLTLLGVVILLHTRAYEQALQTTCSESLLAESWRRCEATATEISDLLSPDVNFSQVGLNTCKHLGMYLSWPVSVAARVQIMRLRGTISTRRNSNGELASNPVMPASPLSPQQLATLQTSLRILDTALRASGTSSAHFDELFKTIRTVLDGPSQSTPRRDLDALTYQRQLSSNSPVERMIDFSY